MKHFGSIAAAVALLWASAASAHTAYLLPQDFTPDDGRVTIEGAYATQFFTPTIALGGPDFHALAPDGARAPFASLSIVSPRTTVELPVSIPGTYRITTGEVLGPVTQMVGVDGGWRALGTGEVPPEGAALSSLQTVTLAEAYVTRGRPNEEPLDDAVGRLIIRPVTHPNRIARTEGFRVRLMFEGAPFPNMPLVLYGANDIDSNLERAFVTDANGEAVLSFDQPGNYVVAVRHRANAPAGAGASVHSYTTSLTFEVFETLPELPPEEPETRRRRNRLREY